jgi:Ulp1 family protease
MAQYIVDEFKDKRAEEIDVSQWARHCPKDIPHQENLCDCGVLMVTFGDYMVREQAPLGLSPRMLFHHATHYPQVLLIGNAGSEFVRLNSIGLIPFNQRTPTNALRALRAFRHRQGSAHPSLRE